MIMRLLGHLVVLALCFWVLTSEPANKRPPNWKRRPIIKPVINFTWGNRNNAKNINKNIKGNVANVQDGTSGQFGGTGINGGKGGGKSGGKGGGKGWKKRGRTAASLVMPVWDGSTGGGEYENIQPNIAQFEDSTGGGMLLTAVPQSEVDQPYDQSEWNMEPPCVVQYIVAPECQLPARPAMPNYLFGSEYPEYPVMVEPDDPFPEEENPGTVMLVEESPPGYDGEDGPPSYDGEESQLTE